MRTITKLLFCTLLILLFIPANIFAVPAYPYPIKAKQPNGEIITIQKHGDEFFNFTTSKDGFIIIPDAEGYYSYATISNNLLEPSKLRVSDSQLRSSLPSDLIKADSKEFNEKIIQPAMERIIMKALSDQKDNSSLRSSTNSKIEGEVKQLVILANFTDVKFTEEQAQQAFSNLLNQPGYSVNGATGSVKDYFMASSNGIYTPDFTVYGPVELPHEMAYYGANDANRNDQNVHQMIIDACLKANETYPALNFSDYDYDNDKYVDNVFILYAGYNEAEGGGANTVWPQQSTVKNYKIEIDGDTLGHYACTSERRLDDDGNDAGTASIGIFCHEFGHVLGLPEFYDADYSTNGYGGGLGTWSLMANGSYQNNSNTPPLFNSMERYMTGWIDIQPLNVSNETQSLTLNPLSTENIAYRINSTTQDEFFLLEARQKSGWDTYIEGEGLLIYHVDMNNTSKNLFITHNGQTGYVSAYELWAYRRAPNIISDHQCMDLLKANNDPVVLGTNKRGFQIAYYQNYSGHPYPYIKDGKVDNNSITDNTIPNLKSWDGKNTGVEISNITKNASGSVTFDYIKSKTSAIDELNPDKPHVYSQGKTVYFQNIKENSFVNVYDLTGRKYVSQMLETDQITLPVSGIYIIQVNNNQQVFNYKVILK